MQRLRALSDEECYLRLYGWVGDDDAVRLIRKRDELDPEGSAVVADRMRRAFEARLDAREPEAA